MDLKNNTKELHEHLDLWVSLIDIYAYDSYLSRYVNNDFFVFQPSDHSACLIVNRSTGVIKLACMFGILVYSQGAHNLLASSDISFHTLSRADRIYGILGLLSLVSCWCHFNSASITKSKPRHSWLYCCHCGERAAWGIIRQLCLPSNRFQSTSFEPVLSISTRSGESFACACTVSFIRCNVLI
jgi:hypothetical protein